MAASQHFEVEITLDPAIAKLRRHVERLQERIKQRSRCRFVAGGEA
jgi:ribosome-associated translation inhibitor RaiA